MCPALNCVTTKIQRKNHGRQEGIILIKYWFGVGMDEQERRFRQRIEDPRKIWYDYSRARDRMLDATDTKWAPWYIVEADVKRTARLKCISHFLSLIPCKALKRDKVELGKRNTKGEYDDKAPIQNRRQIPKTY